MNYFYGTKLFTRTKITKKPSVTEVALTRGLGCELNNRNHLLATDFLVTTIIKLIANLKRDLLHIKNQPIVERIN